MSVAALYAHPDLLAWNRGKLVDSDMILITAVGYPGSGQRLNLMQTHQVGDMAQTLGWKRRTKKRK